MNRGIIYVMKASPNINEYRELNSLGKLNQGMRLKCIDLSSRVREDPQNI